MPWIHFRYLVDNEFNEFKFYIFYNLEPRTFSTNLIVLGFNNTSTRVGHFTSSLREREKSDRRDSRGEEREGQGRKRKMKESDETEKIKTPLPPASTLTCSEDSRPCQTVSQYQLGHPQLFQLTKGIRYH